MKYLTVCLSPTIQKTLRFSSITPDAVNRTGDYRLDASGKGINVSRVLSQLGKDVVHLTQLGTVVRPLFLSLCEEDSLSVRWVESGSAVRFCYTLINDADSSVTELVEEPEPVAAGTEQRLLEQFEGMLADCKAGDCLIVSGSKAGGFSDRVIPTMVQKAKGRGLTVILDVRGKDLTESLAGEPDIIKPNLSEFASTFMTGMAREQVREAALEICTKHRCRIILTKGTGRIWAAEAGNFFEVNVEPVKPLNTTGSGDAFTAGLASALGGGALNKGGTGFLEAIGEGIRCGALNALSFRPGSIR